MTQDSLHVATRKGLMIFQRDTRGWAHRRTAFPGSPVSLSLVSDDGRTVFVALNLGHFGTKLHRSDDDGRIWTELAAPAFPADAADSPALFQVWTLEAGLASEPGRLWAGALPAGLFRSDDRGQHWQFVTSLWNVPERAKWFGGGYDDAGIHTILPDPRSGGRVFIAISCGGVWDTAGDGAQWRLLGEGLVATYMPPELTGVKESQDPHRVARCAAAPDTMWMQHHCGIFRSTDAGATWTQLKPPSDDFGFAVAAHPRDPLTAWFVPAIKDELRIPRDGALVVTRTRDGGKSWQSFRSGLPQHDAYDLIYRHGLDVAGEGRQLAIGSTTGSLWVSEDAGEDWRLINAHLPPIYAVRLY